jgi:hypothetical protein
MRSPFPRELDDHRYAGPWGEPNGHFFFKRGSAVLSVRVSNGGGWDHVSVSLKTRCPTWEEMCYVREKFFADDEWVMQLHPPKTENVNYHPFCLHLWRPQSTEEIQACAADWAEHGEDWPYGLESAGAIPLPPAEFVGPRAGCSVSVSGITSP